MVGCGPKFAGVVVTAGDSVAGSSCFELVNDRCCLLVATLGCGAFVGFGGDPGAAGLLGMLVGGLELGRVEAPRRHQATFELSSERWRLLEVEVAGQTGEMPVDLELGVVVGGLGVGP
jgi:hypothetical protein